MQSQVLTDLAAAHSLHTLPGALGPGVRQQSTGTKAGVKDPAGGSLWRAEAQSRAVGSTQLQGAEAWVPAGLAALVSATGSGAAEAEGRSQRAQSPAGPQMPA